MEKFKKKIKTVGTFFDSYTFPLGIISFWQLLGDQNNRRFLSALKSGLALLGQACLAQLAGYIKEKPIVYKCNG